MVTFSFDLLLERLSSDLNQLIFSGFSLEFLTSGDCFFSDEVRLISNGLAFGVESRRRMDISFIWKKGEKKCDVRDHF